MLRTMDSYKTSNGLEFHGGAFMGNTVEKNPEGEVAKVTAYQEIDTDFLDKADTYVLKGTSIMHELTESYIGAKIAWRKRESTPPAIQIKLNPVYKKAHKRATPQPLYLRWRMISPEGNDVEYPNQAIKKEYFVKPSLDSKEETIIQTVPL